jgi:hypothetical protein
MASATSSFIMTTNPAYHPEIVCGKSGSARGKLLICSIIVALMALE